ncbi:hypothetical protein [Bdellovibrio sp.]|uniref:hypothetical protein n=1 Tax=Bdellovibrio sp. TaxID=28201 RepID=UPI0039E4318D
MDSRRHSLSDKHLIAEQPGMTILLSGFILAFFIGYTTKSILSPARVTAQLTKAASHIHKDVKVKFASAQVSLSNGILPRFAVVISQVEMESSQTCWASPVLEVDELRLPLSLWSILRGGAPVKTIEADNVKILFREEFKNCDHPDVVKQTTTDSATPPPLVTLSPSEQSQKYRNDVQGLSIQKLQISALKYPQYSSELLNFAAKVKSFEPKVIEITAKSHLMRDEQVGDYLSHANLYIQYKESPEATIQSHFFGNWREGHYSIIANYTLAEQLLAVETDLKHIPLSQILTVLQKYNLASKELNGRQVWMSSKARLVAPVDQLRTSPLEVRDLRLEGDLGEMKVDRIDIKSIEPLQYAPIVVDVKKLDVAKLLVLLNRPKRTGVLGELGVFSGRAEIVSDRKIKMTGEHAGLEFVFSNKGQQELQVIENMVGDITLEENIWNFQIHRVEPRGGVFIGNVKMKADKDFREVEAKTRVDEVSLALPVQKLMTNGGDLGLISFDLDMRLKEGQMSYLKGLTRIEGMKVEGLEFSKTKATMDWSQGDVILNTQVKSLKVGPESPGAEVLRKVTMPSWWNSGTLSMSSLTGEFRSKSLQLLSWKNVQGQIGKSGRLVTEGSWNQVGSLRGAVLIREGKTHKKWVIEGSRENPTFEEETSANKQMRK